MVFRLKVRLRNKIKYLFLVFKMMMMINIGSRKRTEKKMQLSKYESLELRHKLTVFRLWNHNTG